jgi:nucleoside-triphosphatase THEP1
MLLLLTGESGCGKTTLCACVVASLKRRGINVAGVLTLPRFVNDEKVGLDVEDVRSGERGVLAVRAEVGTGTAQLGWKFDSAGLARGDLILRTATPCDVLVVDELGPLELDNSQGWVVALEILRAGKFDLAIVVVRPSLIINFKTNVKLDRVITLTALNREESFAEIIDSLELYKQSD